MSSCSHKFNSGSTYSGFLTHCMRKHPGWKEVLSRGCDESRGTASSGSASIEVEATDEFFDEDMDTDQEPSDERTETTDNHFNVHEDKNIDVVSSKVKREVQSHTSCT